MNVGTRVAWASAYFDEVLPTFEGTVVYSKDDQVVVAVDHVSDNNLIIRSIHQVLVIEPSS